ncbi:putative HD-2 (homeodomain) [Paramicrosporidium saccamoebae]|uniref:Putative HD-2 (Homeodomain) n=1 Tax=Paramicrosporidium saccamoebae TaxID=1246581 RepID=A0A2H9TKE1_9FUNG|nr:putative HD-2 (homeodomain) [Paramicrosporidium saccamoebae]
MRLFLQHTSRTKSVIDEAVSAFKRRNLAQANLLLQQNLLEARDIHQELLLEASTKLANEHLAQYARFVRTLSDQVDQKVSDVNNTGASVQRLLLVTPTALMQMSVVMFRFAVANRLYRFQVKILEMSFVHNSLQSTVLTAKRFSNDIISTLTSSYSADSYPGLPEVARLGRVTGLGERQIVMWFTNRRSRTNNKRSRSGKSCDHEILSDANTLSPPDSPSSMISFPPQHRQSQLSSDDNFFQESSRQAELEFYKTMVCNNTRHHWDDYAEFFADIGRH